MSNLDKKITVVTVTYNCVNLLEKTIESVLSQSYNNIEYIIIDGGSKDGTLDIIQKYDKHITRWISEPDKGIYDAMNKAINFAKGGWINFLNAGDIFSNSEIVSVVIKNAAIASYDVIYGDFTVEYTGFQKLVRAKPLKDLWRGMAFCHQSAFTNTSLLKNRPFETRFKITGDFNFYYNLYILGKIFHYIEVNIAVYKAEGLSDTQRIKSIKENLITVRELHGFSLSKEIYYHYKLLNNRFKKLMKLLLPSKIISEIQKY